MLEKFRLGKITTHSRMSPSDPGIHYTNFRSLPKNPLSVQLIHARHPVDRIILGGSVIPVELHPHLRVLGRLLFQREEGAPPHLGHGGNGFEVGDCVVRSII